MIRPDESDVPPEFMRALRSLREHRARAEVRLTEVPAPSRAAPYAVALSGAVLAPRGKLDDEPPELSTGRFVLLYDPDGQDAWEGTHRIATLVRSVLDAEVVEDPLLPEVAWSWLIESLFAEGAAADVVGGTVTRVLSRSFGALATRPEEVEVEIRSSWTPLGEDMASHLTAWCTLLCTVAGLPPLPEGVTALGPRR